MRWPTTTTCQDAEWIQQNVEAIARAIVQALCTYFGIPFAEPQPVRQGTVNTGGANLNIRSMPTTASTIVAVAPNGAQLTIYSQSGDWYAVRYQNATGYDRPLCYSQRIKERRCRHESFSMFFRRDGSHHPHHLSLLLLPAGPLHPRRTAITREFSR